MAIRPWFLFCPFGERRAIWNDGAIAIAPYGGRGMFVVRMGRHGAIAIAPYDLYDHVNVVGHYNEFINDAFFSYNGDVFDFMFHDTSVFG
jgi:hypothetical protein